jgi:hypothetical protein
MNPEWNTETKILYHLGTVLVVVTAVAVVLLLLPSDLANALQQNKFLGTAFVSTLTFLGIALFHDRSFRNLLMAIPGGLLFSFMLNVLWPKWGAWRMVALSAAAIAVGALVVWRRGANQRSA